VSIRPLSFETLAASDDVLRSAVTSCFGRDVRTALMGYSVGATAVPHATRRLARLGLSVGAWILIDPSLTSPLASVPPDLPTRFVATSVMDEDVPEDLDCALFRSALTSLFPSVRAALSPVARRVCVPSAPRAHPPSPALPVPTRCPTPRIPRPTRRSAVR
jgi:hypothetical protein